MIAYRYNGFHLSQKEKVAFKTASVPGVHFLFPWNMKIELSNLVQIKLKRTDKSMWLETVIWRHFGSLNVKLKCHFRFIGMCIFFLKISKL